MNQYNSYYLYQQYEKRGNQDWLPSYPNIFSVDGDGTMPLVMKKENDPDCGYTGDTEPIYRWYPLPITTDYICDECPAVTYRWENMDPSTDYYCDGTTKYYKQKKQYSMDDETWYDVVPPEYRQGSVYEQYSTDCGYTPTGYKLTATYKNGSIYSLGCGSTTLTSGDTRPAGYTYSAMTSAVIGDCVTTIGTEAFGDGDTSPFIECENLTSVTISDNVTSINSSAFSHAFKLKRINSNVDGVFNFPTGVTRISDAIFEYCYELETMNIPTGVTSIGQEAFWYCYGLRNIVIPAGVTYIGNGAFYACTGLTSINVPTGITSINNYAFGLCESLTGITIPTNVVRIGNNAFERCGSFTSIVIPSNVTTIGSSAFTYCGGLTSIDIPSNVTSIGDSAFRNCSGLTGVTVNATTPPTLGTNAFSNTNNCPIYVPCESYDLYANAAVWSGYSSRLKHNGGIYRTTSGTPYCNGEDKYVDVYNQVSCDGVIWKTISTASTRVEQQSLDCLRSIITGGGTREYWVCTSNTVMERGKMESKYMAETPFGTSGAHIWIGDCITEIESQAFDGRTHYAVGGISGGANLEIIGSSAFGYNHYGFWLDGLTGLTSLKTIEDYAFYDTYDTSSPAARTLRLADTLETIGRSAFEKSWGANCTMVIPSGITYVGTNAFKDSGIKVVFEGDTPPTFASNALSGASGYVRCEVYDTYVEALGSSSNLYVTGLSECSIIKMYVNSSGEVVRYNGKKDISYGEVSGYSSTITAASITDVVTSIGIRAFRNCSGLTNVSISNTVKSIGSGAFSGCTSLPNIVIPNTVTSLGSGAFSGCTNLTAITLSSGITKVNDNTFYRCTGLTSIDIPSSVTSIGASAFFRCYSLTSLDIPSGVTSIGSFAFMYCSGLTGITVNATTPPTLGDNVFEDTNNCPIYVPCSSLERYLGKWSTYTNRIHGIPPCAEPVKLTLTLTGGTTYETRCNNNSQLTRDDVGAGDAIYASIGLCVTSIGDAFYGYNSLTGVSIPTSVTSIGKNAFYQCRGLARVNIPNSVTSIGEQSFYYCTGLTSCTIGSSVASIGKSAFQGCSNITSVTIPNSVTSIGSSAFYACIRLSSCTIGNSVTTIGSNAFWHCNNLARITIPDSVTSLGSYAFYGCSGLTSCSIGGGVTSIGDRAFSICSRLTGITIPDNVTRIGEYAFSGCTSLSSCTIGNGVTSIGQKAFYQCRSLTSCTIGSGVTSIGTSAFENCSGLTSITIDAVTPPTLGSYALYNTNSCPIYVPCESLAEYKSSWSDYIGRIRCAEQYRTTSGTPYCNGVDKYVDVYSQVSTDGGTTWSTTATTPTLVEANSSDCAVTTDKKLHLVYDGGSVYDAECDGNTTIWSNDVKPTGTEYSAMTSAVVGDCVTTIGFDAFSRCSAMTRVYIPDSVTVIDNQAFEYCTALRSINIPDSVTTIDNYAFTSCYSATLCIIGSGVTSIGYQGFAGGTNLAAIIIKATKPPRLDDYAFYNTNNCPIYVPAGSLYWYTHSTSWSQYVNRIQEMPS